MLRYIILVDNICTFKFSCLLQNIFIIACILLKKHIFIIFLLALIVISHLIFFVRFSGKNVLKKSLSFALFILLFVSWLYANINYNAPFVYKDIDTIIGVLVSDTSLSRSGSSIYDIKLESVEKENNIKIKSPGAISIVVKNQKMRGIAGEIYRFLGPVRQYSFLQP